MPRKINLEKTPAENWLTTVSSSSNTSSNIIISPSAARYSVPKKQMQHAILAHIKAVRVLGRTEINTQEIANSLNISVKEVNDTIDALKKQGVRRR